MKVHDILSYKGKSYEEFLSIFFEKRQKVSNVGFF